MWNASGGVPIFRRDEFTRIIDERLDNTLLENNAAQRAALFTFCVGPNGNRSVIGLPMEIWGQKSD
jgi:hypothetical protein